MDLTRSQIVSLNDIMKWWTEKQWLTIGKYIFRQGGPAGTGKTFLIQAFIEAAGLQPHECLILAYTGQAVNILRQKDLMAYTIHSTVMKYSEVDKYDEYNNLVHRGGIPLKEVKFVPVDSIPPHIKLIIIDESSFLPKTLETLLKGYGIPILEVGDPFQLPPVADEQCFTLELLDSILEDPVRQLADSEIIDIATKLRRGEKIEPSKYWKDVLFIKSKGSAKKDFHKFFPFFKYSDIILTCTNRQREDITKEYRAQILKTDNIFPIRGEKLICRKNNWNYKLGQYPLTNGTIGYTVGSIPRSMIDYRAGIFYVDFRPHYIDYDYFDNMICDANYFMQPFGEKVMDRYNPGNKMEFAHAITTHLSQGSQFPTVAYFDKWHGTAEYMSRIRYTAITRAQKKFIFFLNV